MSLGNPTGCDCYDLYMICKLEKKTGNEKVFSCLCPEHCLYKCEYCNFSPDKPHSISFDMMDWGNIP
jgi:hypothetical protein